MEYYPQDSALLSVARERIRDSSLGSSLPKAIKKQVKVVLDSCASDTQMFLLLSELLYVRAGTAGLDELVRELLG